VSKVTILPPEEAERIAAGEVVERPAAAVKELIENALDAGAGRIRIQIDGGGLERIRVADDGRGMSPRDARLALQRHATSKISCLDDLQNLSTLGFRGEALPSIAAVSRLTLESTDGDEGSAVRLQVEAGKLQRDEPASRPRGTTVTVEDLFFNTPARKKFLKKASAEFARISEVTLPEMLARPQVGFRLAHHDRVSVDVAPAADLRERIAGLWGGRVAAGLMAFGRDAAQMRIDGLVSGPDETRASRRGWHLFVNGRPVRDPLLLHAAGEGISGSVPRGRFPLLFLFLEVPGNTLDVNVHPAKTEVRFAERGPVFSLVRGALKSALMPATVLGRSSGVPPQVPAGGGTGGWEIREPAEPTPGEPSLQTPAVNTPRADAWVEEKSLFREPARQGTTEPGEEETASAEAPADPGTPPVVLAQYRDCFIMAHDDDAFYMLDQHAAHERVLYEEIRSAFAARESPRQALLFPATIPVPPGHGERLDAVLPTLHRLGFTAESFGEDALLVRQIPDRLTQERALEALHDILLLLLEGDIPGADEAAARERLEHRLAATMACHSAVRLHDSLTRERMAEIVERWLGCSQRLTCPHGRTAVVRWPHGQLLKSFGRA
jgi:DNA mismatch repair protein MutL